MEQQERKQRAKEENAIVLDFLPNGYSDDKRPFHLKEPIIQAMGKDHFTLLELVPAEGVKLAPHEEIYIGEGKREQVSYIKAALFFDRLTQTAKSVLNDVVRNLVEKNEEKYVEFFNNAGPISLRAHQMELLPGVGKRHAKDLLAEREKDPFTSFQNIKQRVPAVEPAKQIIGRIMEELEGKDRFRLFVRV